MLTAVEALEYARVATRRDANSRISHINLEMLGDFTDAQQDTPILAV